MSKFRNLFLSFLLYAFPVLVSAQVLDSLSTAVLDSCLNYLHLDLDELGFEKALVEDDTFKLQIVEQILDEPLKLSDYLLSTADNVQNLDNLNLADFIAAQLDTKIEKIETLEISGSLPLETIIEEELDKAFPYIMKFYAELDSLELHDLIMSAPAMWCGDNEEENKSLRGVWQREFHTFVDTSRSVDQNRLLNIMKKIDRTALYNAGLINVRLIEAFKQIDFGKYNDLDFAVDGVSGNILYYANTKYGEIIIGSSDDNIYSRDFAFMIDVGGNDTYRCRAGGALGVLSNPFSFVLDLEGDDFYFNEDRSISFGSGFLGIGILYDLNGNDVYRGANYTQGSGICGIGILNDSDGTDDYRGGCFTQGAGHYGFGLLRDFGEGDDRYSAKLCAQGFGSTFGYGLLHDTGGDEIYKTGGEYLHAPLLPNDYQSFSHGFGMGWRPRAGGGIGVLLDEKGNDFYDGEVFCEGSSYWYSLGLLIDGGGNDSYSAAQYAQGAGVHLAIGALWEQDGDDQYHSRLGVVGGTAHDYSVGMLVDEKGDDNYIVSGGYGVSLTNSFALFIDKLGDDMYSTWEEYSLGAVRWGRGFAGCGVFMDLEGKDTYPRNKAAKDNGLWLNNDWGIGIDLDRNIVTKPELESVEEIILTAEDTLKSVEELFAEASLWGVGSNQKKVARAKKAFLRSSKEGIDYICANKLGTDSSLELRLIETMTNEYPDLMGSLLLDNLKNENLKIQKNSIRLLGIAKYQAAYEPLIKMLKSNNYDKIKRTIIVALGNIGNKSASLVISDHIKDKEEICRISVISALRKLEDKTANYVLVKALEDDMFTVRSAAYSALIELADLQTSRELYSKIINEELVYPELALRTLAKIQAGFADSTSVNYKEQRKLANKLFVKLLKNEDSRVRAEAVRSILMNFTEKKRVWLTEFINKEPDPYVVAVYEETKKYIER
ncbi:MAG: hypothetical protein K9N07_04775 [Candidatus Cloacimonetes bacterium]|nr:hypothetical protein [Candidatus Cloacimonadota bacterium]